MEKQERNWSKKARWVSLAAVVAGILIIVGAVVALRGRDSCQIKEPVSISINGMLCQYPDGLQLQHKDGHTFLKEKFNARLLETFPLILDKSGELLLQKSMIWTQTKEEHVLRLDYFSRVEQLEDNVVLSRGQTRVEGADGFLYDGEDTYIFLESAQLTWNKEQKRTIEPLTIVQVVYGEYIHIYGPGQEPLFEELSTEEVTAEFDSQKRINLATDRYFMPNGVWRLLFLPIEQLDTIK